MTNRLDCTHSSKPGRAWWPDEQALTLLRACFLSGDAAIKAWAAWQAAHDLADSDLGTLSLLPLLYQNLNDQAVDHPLMGRLKGYQHYTWASNVSRMGHLMPLVDDLQQQGIEVALLKGAVLPTVFFGQPGLRSAADFGLLVRPDQRQPTFELLETWRFRPRRAVPESRLPLMHRLEFEDENGAPLIVQWRLLWECALSGGDDVGDAWMRRIPVEVGGVRTYTLCAADHLLQVCSDGAWVGPESAVRWVADALAIIRSPRPVDWDRLAAQAETYHLTLLLRQSLSDLAAAFAADIPPPLIERLCGLPVSRLEWLEDRIKRRLSAQRASATGLLLRYLRGLHQPPGSRLSLARFLQQWWGLDSYRQLPSGVARALRNRSAARLPAVERHTAKR